MWGVIVRNPIHFIIFSAPVVLGVTFYFIGTAVENREAANRELERKNKAIASNNELLDTFNYHVSHDLKTVLNNQLTLARMQEKYVKLGDLEKVQELTQRLTKSADTGLETVHNFLQISQSGFMTPDAKVGTLNVPHEIRRIIDEHNLKERIEVQLKSIAFSEINLGKKVFESVILNLMTNAIKYNNKSPKVLIELKIEDSHKKLIFRDNGIGIDLDKNGDRLFSPFDRIENGRETEGSGIGLFLVKKILNTIGHEIEVESELGQGTTFTIIFHEK